jgi:hypothetical protein
MEWSWDGRVRSSGALAKRGWGLVLSAGWWGKVSGRHEDLHVK